MPADLTISLERNARLDKSVQQKKEDDMQFFPVRARSTTLLAVLLALVACGCKEASVDGGHQVHECACGDINIKVNHGLAKGVDKKVVYLCKNYKIIWEAVPSVKSFKVEFEGPDFPFGPGPSNTKFDSNSNGQASTPPLPTLSETTIFKYKITITDSSGNEHPFDPHVIGGG